ncbi:MAG: DUF1476 domain-containing protein [Pseudorhodoplanes sp.]
MTVNVVPALCDPSISSGGANAWCSDADTRDNVLARRNVLAGLWAGELMGLPNHAVQSYVAAVHRADFRAPGDGDVVDKLFGDLSRSGIDITRDAVHRKLCEFYRQAIAQTRETD